MRYIKSIEEEEKRQLRIKEALSISKERKEKELSLKREK